MSEANELNISSTKHFDVKTSKFTFNEITEGMNYAFAVQLRTEDGYFSRLSGTSFMSTPQGKLG